MIAWKNRIKILKVQRNAPMLLSRSIGFFLIRAERTFTIMQYGAVKSIKQRESVPEQCVLLSLMIYIFGFNQIKNKMPSKQELSLYSKWRGTASILYESIFLVRENISLAG